MKDSDWNWVQDKSGTCILSIVMQLVDGRSTPGETMDAIEQHCGLCFEAGTHNKPLEPTARFGVFESKKAYFNYIKKTDKIL